MVRVARRATILVRCALPEWTVSFRLDVPKYHLAGRIGEVLAGLNSIVRIRSWTNGPLP